jgi:type IV fimbrial biogenesis protein FimT
VGMGISRGFTLIELLATVAIAGLVLAFAVPSFTRMIQNNRMTSQVNDFVTSLNLARSEAVKRATKVALCKSRDGQSCASNGDWEQGWIVFVDSNDDAVRDTTETLLQVRQALRGGNTLIGNSDVDSYISYAATGFTQLKSGGGFQAGTLILCDSRGFGDDAKAIVLNRTGRPSTMKATDTDKSRCNAT